MSTTISRTVIERARERADIVAIIDSETRLELTGRLYCGACLFHQDDRHDLLVDPTRRRFLCVGCWAAGDVIEFHHRLHKVSHAKAMWQLGLDHGAREPTFDAVPEAEPEYSGVGLPAFVITRAGTFVDVRVCPGPIIKIGRIASSTLQLDDLKVSRMHAVIELSDRAWLIDLGSADGTYVNDVQMRTKAALQVGDVVRFGDHELRLVELVRPRTPDLAHEAALASARVCLTLAEQSLAQERPDDARAQLRAARAHVRDPALERVRVLLGGLDEAAWPADEQGIACWLDAAGLARIDALHGALLAAGHGSDDEHLREAMEWAVFHDPADDGPRLVYADWLQQRGDPRGEFVTLSIAEQRGSLDIPGQWRLQELLERHRVRWSAEFTTHGATVEFQRGFPAVVRHPGLWSRALIELVRRCTTIYRAEGPRVPEVLTHLA